MGGGGAGLSLFLFFRLCLHAPSSFSSFLPIKAYMCFTFMRRRRGHRPDFHGVVMNSNVSPSGGAVTRISPPYFNSFNLRSAHRMGGVNLIAPWNVAMNTSGNVGYLASKNECAVALQTLRESVMGEDPEASFPV